MTEGTVPQQDDAARALQVQMQEQFYAVSGRSASALNLALLHGVPRMSGRAAHALTEWHVRWSYIPVLRGSTCACGSPSVELEIVTTLPRWRELPQAPDPLVRDWMLYLRRLRAHESGHQSLALRNGTEVLAVLGKLQAHDCEMLREEVERAVSLLGSRYHRRHKGYDLASDYGVSPGET